MSRDGSTSLPNMQTIHPAHTQTTRKLFATRWLRLLDQGTGETGMTYCSSWPGKLNTEYLVPRWPWAAKASDKMYFFVCLFFLAVSFWVINGSLFPSDRSTLASVTFSSVLSVVTERFVKSSPANPACPDLEQRLNFHSAHPVHS